MINLKLSIDKRRQKQDATYPLVFRITTGGSTRDLQTGYSVLLNQWNKRTRSLTKLYPAHEAINERLKELEVEYLSKIAEYQSHNKGVTTHAQDVKNHIVEGPMEQVSVYDFWKCEIELMHKFNRSSGALIYKQALTAINKIRSLKVSFDKVDYNFLREVDAQFTDLFYGIKCAVTEPIWWK